MNRVGEIARPTLWPSGLIMHGKDEHGNDVTPSEQYQKKLKTYRASLNRIGLHATLYLLCLHDNPLGEFERCPVAKDMWGQLKIKFGHTSATRLSMLCLKYMEYKLDSGQPITEQLGL